MDLNKIIAGLRSQRDKLDVVIKQIETLNGSGTVMVLPHSRRGPKSMGEKARRDVSARMNEY